MKVSEYERKFRELSKFYNHLILDKERKKYRFMEGLNESITLNIYGQIHPSKQSVGMKCWKWKGRFQHAYRGIDCSRVLIQEPSSKDPKNKATIQDPQVVEDEEEADRVLKVTPYRELIIFSNRHNIQ